MLKGILYPLLSSVPIGGKHKIFWIPCGTWKAQTSQLKAFYATQRSAQEQGKLQFRPWQGVIIHHTWKPTIQSAMKSTPIKRFAYDIDNYHRLTRGWKHGLGYDFLLEADGSIAVSVRWQEQLIGAHCKGKNATWIGIGIVGNFDSEIMLISQYSSLVAVLSFTKEMFGVPCTVSQIRYHREYAPKTCPGTLFLDSEKDQLMTLVKEPTALPRIIREKISGCGGMLLR